VVAARKPKRSSRTDIRQVALDLAAERDGYLEQLEVASAQREQLRQALVAVLATLPHEFTTPEVQAVRRRARAVVEETGTTGGAP